MSEIYPFMVGNPDPGAYQTAFDYALPVFRSLDPGVMATSSETTFDPKREVFTIPSFGQLVEVTYPEGKVTFAGTDLTPLVGWQLIMVNHLARANGAALTGRLISYRELDNGNIFFNAFQRESIKPLGKLVTQYPASTIREAIARLDGDTTTGADLAFICRAMPRFPITVKLWWPDEELPGSGNILFDSSASYYLHTEDIAVTGHYVSAFLIRLLNLLKGNPGREYHIL